MSTVEAWIAQVSGGRSLRQVAADAGIPAPTFTRQVRDETLTAENAVKVARAYQRSPLAALTAMGILRPDETAVGDVEQALREATDEQLVAEVLRRIQLGSGARLYSVPLHDVTHDDDDIEHLITLNPAASEPDGDEDPDAEVEAQQYEP